MVVEEPFLRFFLLRSASWCEIRFRCVFWIPSKIWTCRSGRVCIRSLVGRFCRCLGCLGCRRSIAFDGLVGLIRCWMRRDIFYRRSIPQCRCPLLVGLWVGCVDWSRGFGGLLLLGRKLRLWFDRGFGLGAVERMVRWRMNLGLETVLRFLLKQKKNHQKFVLKNTYTTAKIKI